MAIRPIAPDDADRLVMPEHDAIRSATDDRRFGAGTTPAARNDRERAARSLGTDDDRTESPKARPSDLTHRIQTTSSTPIHLGRQGQRIPPQTPYTAFQNEFAPSAAGRRAHAARMRTGAAPRHRKSASRARHGPARHKGPRIGQIDALCRTSQNATLGQYPSTKPPLAAQLPHNEPASSGNRL